jgi:peptidyl-prolyl cis-trans isomerase SurA
MRYLQKISYALLLTVAALNANESATKTKAISGIAVVVNKDSITEQDIQDRIRLVMFTSGMMGAGAKSQLREQVVQTLIDEALQLQKAKELKLVVSDEDVERQLENIARENGKTLAQLTSTFKANGIKISSLKHRIKAQMTWARLIREAFGHMVSISQSEIDDVKERIADNVGKTTYDYAEIVLNVSGDKDESVVKAEADRIASQLKSGADFKAMARQFSQSSTAQSGGDVKNLGDVPLDEIEETLKTLEPGRVSSPVKTSRGYMILKLKSKKLSDQAKGETLVFCASTLIPLNEGMSEDEQRTISSHIEILQSKKCTQAFEGEAKVLGYKVQKLDGLNILQFPAEYQKIIRTTTPNTVLPPIREPEGLRVLMLKKVEFKPYTPPSDDDIKHMIEQEKFGKISQRESNKLKAIAFIDRK